MSTTTCHCVCRKSKTCVCTCVDTCVAPAGHCHYTQLNRNKYSIKQILIHHSIFISRGPLFIHVEMRVCRTSFRSLLKPLSSLRISFGGDDNDVHVTQGRFV